MWLKHQDKPIADAPRYDAATLGKVAALAARLQSRHQETLTANEIEAIGQEVGLEPGFIRQALAQFTRTRTARGTHALRHRPRQGQAVAKAWWAAGWTIPVIAAILGGGIIGDVAITFILVLIGLAVYIATGVILSHGPEEVAAHQELSRTTLLEMLFSLQKTLEGQKQHRAFLSVDVVDSSEMKRSMPELAVEYSFGQYRRWVEDRVRECDGEMQSAAGDGVMCIFPTDLGAVRAARELQQGLARFNAEQNRLPTTFRIRCGASAGEVAIEPGVPLGHLYSAVIDRAAALQKRAAPGDILVGAEMAGAAVLELGHVTPLPEPVGGAPAFSWRGGTPADPPASV
jgi:class 3 adenylate cyclase